MRRLLLVCFALIVLCGSASADAYMIPDSAGYDMYQVITPDSGFLLTSCDVIHNPPYNLFYSSLDDDIGTVEFKFTTTDMTNFSLPVTFYYDDVVKEGNIVVTFTNVSNWVLVSTSDVKVALTDSYGEICSTTFSVVNDASVTVLFTRDAISVGRYSGMLSACMDDGILPCDYISFDFSDITTASSMAFITVNDNDYYDNIDQELDGLFGWIYRRIDFMFADDDMGIFYLFKFLNFAWDAGTFVIHFIMTGFWYCVMLVEVISLAWAVMSRTLAKAIERYILMHYYALLLPYNLFKLFVTIFLSIVRTLRSIIPLP